MVDAVAGKVEDRCMSMIVVAGRGSWQTTRAIFARMMAEHLTFVEKRAATQDWA